MSGTIGDARKRQREAEAAQKPSGLEALLAEHRDATRDSRVRGGWACYPCGARLDTTIEFSPGRGETPVDNAFRAHLATALLEAIDAGQVPGVAASEAVEHGTPSEAVYLGSTVERLIRDAKAEAIEQVAVDLADCLRFMEDEGAIELGDRWPEAQALIDWVNDR